MKLRKNKNTKLKGVQVNGSFVKCQEHDMLDVYTGNTFSSNSWVSKSIIDVLNK